MTGHQKDNLVVLTALHEIITPPYPATTLDNFCFMVGGHLAAWPAVFCPSGWIVLVIPHLLGKVELHCIEYHCNVYGKMYINANLNI